MHFCRGIYSFSIPSWLHRALISPSLDHEWSTYNVINDFTFERTSSPSLHTSSSLTSSHGNSYWGQVSKFRSVHQAFIYVMQSATCSTCAQKETRTLWCWSFMSCVFISLNWSLFSLLEWLVTVIAPYSAIRDAVNLVKEVLGIPIM